jgi:Holliday junction DNA helicase RuvA
MIGLLRGHVLEKHPDRLLVDVQGVGYEVFVPLSTFYTLPDADGDVTLRIHTHVREDQLALYGFATVLEQQLFERLIGVSGIGPRLALAALSGIEPSELVRAVRTSDIARLTSIPGVGRKTAERIALELKDKLPVSAAAAPAGAAPSGPEADLRADVLSALVNLGYQRAGAEKAIDAALKSLGATAAFEVVLRQALKGLSR